MEVTTHCANGNAWIWSAFSDCVVTNRQYVGFYVGAASTVIWVFALLPQLRENHRQRAVEGLSLAMCLFFVLGDLCNLEGALLAKQTAPQKAIALWQLLVDSICVLQWLYYGIPSKTPFSARTLLFHSAFYVVSVLVTWHLLGPYGDPATRASLGDMLGYLSALSYLCSRFPQIWHNLQRKSTAGLSVFIFFLSIAGNVTYGVSVILMATSVQSILVALPWLLGSLGTVLLDVALLMQFWYYYHEYTEVP